MSAASIRSVGAALPPVRRQDHLWQDFFAEYYSHNRIAERLFRSVGVETRGGVVDPSVEDVSQWSTRARMERFVTEALPLGKEALGAAFELAGVNSDELGMLVVASCTGYATPGLNILLARDMGLHSDLRSLMLGHMGCYAALPALGAAMDYVNVHQKPALVLCVELTSLHLQPAQNALPQPLTPDDVQQMIVHALFSDAAAAVVVSPEPQAGSLEVMEIAAFTDTATTEMMTWDITDLGFRMGLSPEVPDVLARRVRPAMEQLLARHDLGLQDVAGWAVHPGGPRILETVGTALDLSSEQLRPSRDVLREYGNCSSATILLVLDRVQRTASSGEYVVALAFGPGLTLYAALLRVG